MYLTPEQERALEALKEALRQASWHSDYIRVRQDDIRVLVKLILKVQEE